MSKTESIEKVRSVPNERKQQSFYTKMSDIRNAFLAKKPMYLLLYNDANLDINDSLPSITIVLLQDYKDVFPEEMPPGLLAILLVPFQNWKSQLPFKFLCLLLITPISWSIRNGCTEHKINFMLNPSNRWQSRWHLFRKYVLIIL